MEGAAGQRTLARVRDRGVVVDAACVVVIALVAWRVDSVRPGAAADWNWIATLSYAAEHGLRFGSHIVWSYGPLGFLNSTFGPVLYYDDLLFASWLYTAALQLALAGALLAALRRSFPLPAATLLAAIVLALTFDLAPALALACCALMLARDEKAPRERATAAFAPAIGVLAGLALLGKLNQGVEVAALAIVVLVFDPRRRDALAFAGALLASVAAGWFATGQTLADVWPYVRYGGEVIGGYAAAMGTTDAPGWSYPVALGIVAVGVAVAWDAMRAHALRRLWGLLGLVVVYSAFSFKEGFVRHDPSHLAVFFASMAALFAVLPVKASRRPVVLAGIAATAVAMGALVGASDVARKLNPYANVAAAADQVRTLASPARREEIVADTRRTIIGGYGVTPPVLAAVGRHSLMLWPFLYGEVAWAYDLDLRPLPTLEPYAAYTPSLDRLGARMLASPQAPERIMRAKAPALDGRNTTFEAPLATLAIFCRYRQLLAREPWQVLAPAPNRCGAPRALGTVSAAWGAEVPVPAPRRRDALVLVHVDGAGTQGLERLTGLVLRPRRRWIALDGQVYRLIAATAADGLLLSAPPALDYQGQFAMAPNPGAIAVGRDGGQPGGRIHYRFEEVPVGRFRAPMPTAVAR